MAIRFEHLMKPPRLRMYTPDELIEKAIWHTPIPRFFDLYRGRGKRNHLFVKAVADNGKMVGGGQLATWLMLPSSEVELPVGCSSLEQSLTHPMTIYQHDEMVRGLLHTASLTTHRDRFA